MSTSAELRTRHIRQNLDKFNLLELADHIDAMRDRLEKAQGTPDEFHYRESLTQLMNEVRVRSDFDNAKLPGIEDQFGLSDFNGLKDYQVADRISELHFILDRKKFDYNAGQIEGFTTELTRLNLERGRRSLGETGFQPDESAKADRVSTRYKADYYNPADNMHPDAIYDSTTPYHLERGSLKQSAIGGGTENE